MSAVEEVVDHTVWSRAVPPRYVGPIPGADDRILAQLRDAVVDGQLDSRLVTALVDAERCSFNDVPATSAWMATSGVELVVDLRERIVQPVAGASLVQVVELDEYIRHQLATPLRLRGAGGAELGSAVPAPYWPPRRSKPLHAALAHLDDAVRNAVRRGDRSARVRELAALADWVEGLVELPSPEVFDVSALLQEFSIGIDTVDRPGTSIPEPFVPRWLDREADALGKFLLQALGEGLPTALADSSVAGSARPDPWSNRYQLRNLARLQAYLQHALRSPIELGLGDGAAEGSARAEPYVAPWFDGLSEEFHAALRDLLDGFRAPLDPFDRVAPTVSLSPLLEANSAGSFEAEETSDPAAVASAATNVEPVRGLSPEATPVFEPVARSNDHRTRRGAGRGALGRARLESPPDLPGGQLELQLRERLSTVELVGDLPLDDYAAEIERSLRTLLSGGATVERLRNMYPATLASYMVHQGLQHSDGSELYPRLSIRKLRDGPIGEATCDALQLLGLPDFPELEEAEGIGYKRRYVRRIFLHGGISRARIPKVMDELVTSLWAGAVSGREVVSAWLDSAHVDQRIGTHTRRFLAYTNAGEAVMSALVDLVRDHKRGGSPTNATGLPVYLRDGCSRWLEEHPERVKATWGSRTRPLVRLAAQGGRGPVVEFPEVSMSWTLNGLRTWHGSAAQKQTEPLPFVGSGRWNVAGRDDSRSASSLVVESAAKTAVVLVFDQRGRLHPHRLPLGGVRATVIAPAGSRCDSEVDRQPLVGDWSNHDLIDVRLAGSTSVAVVLPDKSTLNLRVDGRLRAAVAADIVEHLATSTGDPVYAGPPRLAFRGFVPDPADVLITVNCSELGETCVHLDDHRIEALGDGTFGFGRLFDPERVSLGSIKVEVDGLPCEEFCFGRLPSTALGAVSLTHPSKVVPLDLATPEQWLVDPTPLVVSSGEDEVRFSVLDEFSGLVRLTARVPRLRWDTYRGSEHVFLSDTPFQSRVSDLRTLSVRLRTGVPCAIRPRLRSLEGRVLQTGRDLHTDGEFAACDFGVGQFVDTARSLRDEDRVVLEIASGATTVPIGDIEVRYRPVDLRVSVDEVGGRLELAATWAEFLPTTGRVVRLWDATSRSLFTTWSVPDGVTSVVAALPEDCPGTVLVEVDVDDTWAVDAPDYPGERGVLLDLDTRRLRAVAAAIETTALDELGDETLARALPVVGKRWAEMDAARDLVTLIGEVRDFVLSRPEWTARLAQCAVTEPSRAGRSVSHVLVALVVAARDLAASGRELPADVVADLWSSAPAVAALADPFVGDVATTASRWEAATDWSPRPGATSATALNLLVRNLDWALSDAEVDAERSPRTPILGTEAWSFGMHAAAGPLSRWQIAIEHGAGAMGPTGLPDYLGPLAQRHARRQARRPALMLVARCLRLLQSADLDDELLHEVVAAGRAAPALLTSALTFAAACQHLIVVAPELADGPVRLIT